MPRSCALTVNGSVDEAAQPFAALRGTVPVSRFRALTRIGRDVHGVFYEGLHMIPKLRIEEVAAFDCHIPQGRMKLLRAAWIALYPARAYVCWFPITKGKGLIIRNLLEPLLPPPPAEMTVKLRGSLRIRLGIHTVLGKRLLFGSSYEAAEMDYLREILPTDGVMVDVGANVGLYSVILGKHLEHGGRLFAIEPLPDNINHLSSNLSLNGLFNVTVVSSAVSDAEGERALRLADDPAFSSLGDVRGNRKTGKILPVSVTTLDHLWISWGRPKVHAVKIDVEGEELRVLRGAKELIAYCHPTFIVEADLGVEELTIYTWAAENHYGCIRPKSFARNFALTFSAPPSGEVVRMPMQGEIH